MLTISSVKYDGSLAAITLHDTTVLCVALRDTPCWVTLRDAPVVCNVT